MKTIHTEIGIGAPAGTVWETICDLDGWEQWNPIMKASGKVALGACPTVTISPPGGKAIQLQPKITHLEEGKEFRWCSGLRLRFLFQGEHGFRVVPEDVGRCRFEQFEIFSGLLSGTMLSRSGKAIETGFQAMNRMLKREAERRERTRT